MRNKRTFLHCVSNNSRECVLEYDPVMDGPLDFYIKSERWRVVQEFFTEQCPADIYCSTIKHRWSASLTRPGVQGSEIDFWIDSHHGFHKRDFIRMDNSTWTLQIVNIVAGEIKDGTTMLQCVLVTNDPENYVIIPAFQSAKYLTNKW